MFEFGLFRFVWASNTIFISIGEIWTANLNDKRLFSIGAVRSNIDIGKTKWGPILEIFGIEFFK